MQANRCSTILIIDEDMARTNLRENTVDGLRSQLDLDRDDAPGIRLGSFILKPALGQTFNYESTRTGSSKESRSYLETGLKGTLTSDWSRHQLSVTGEGTWQRNLSGSGETEPTADIEAALRLDIGDDTTGTLKAGYHFEREDATDPNAISGASTQSGVNQYTLGAGIAHDFGILRGSAKVDYDRYVYGDVDLSDGSTLSQEDRNRNAGAVTLRVGLRALARRSSRSSRRPPENRSTICERTRPVSSAPTTATAAGPASRSISAKSSAAKSRSATRPTASTTIASTI